MMRVASNDALRAQWDAAARGEAQKGGRPPSANKFHAEATKTEHGKFDSRYEANWGQTLKYLEGAGYIGGVELDKRQLKYALDVNQVRIAQYEADARFKVLQDFPMPTFAGEVLLRAGAVGVLDAKSVATRKLQAFVMKRNLMFAIYNIQLLEV